MSDGGSESEHSSSVLRAYVEFHRSSSKTSGVLPEVSLALLLAQQRLPLDLFVHSTDEVEAKAGGRTVSPLRYARYAPFS